MTRRAVLVAFALVIAVSNLAWAERQLEKEQLAELRAADRFVDFGVRLVTVRMDLQHGEELIPGAPPLVILRERRFGGMVDTRAKPIRFCGPSRDPVVWYCSEDQEPIIVHGDDLPDRLLVYGSEGAGKTAAQSMWAGLQAIRLTGAPPSQREIGMTAPTNERAERIFEAIQERWPASWYRWVDSDRCFYLANGCRLRLVSTHRQSKAEGSRVQGYNWAACGSDEIQDSTETDSDIEMRGRSAPRGRYKRFCTATAKDEPKWRTFRDGLLKAVGEDGRRLWHRALLSGPTSPFVWPRVWAERKETLLEREYQRRVLAMDVGPEQQIYHTWNRALNLRPRPVGDHVASDLLRAVGPGFGALVGHDPGQRTRCSHILLPYATGPSSYAWWVVDELVSEHGTIEEHVIAVRDRLRERWGCNRLGHDGKPVTGAARALVRADPYTDNGNDAKHPDRSVYTQFRKHGFFILPAASRVTNGESRPAQIPREARIDMVCTLLCNAAKERRLFVDCDENRKPCAPRLVAAFETMERDAAGRAETERKGEGDQSHFPASVGYALWSIERPKLLRSVA